MSEATYDRIGRGYSEFRRADPRIAAQLEAALGEARTVLNVGAGAGSYEPVDREVTAVEPSALMIGQRPVGAAAAIQASAEALPLEDDSFDAAMAIITVHHWADLRAGIAEMVRVARRRLLILSFDPEPLDGLWLGEYFPRALEIHAEAMPPIERLVEMLPSATSVDAVPIPRHCEDGFFLALWDRPELHLDPAVRRASSVWHGMPRDQVERGLAALWTDLESGRWDERHGQLREAPELDVGLRLVVAEVG